MIQTLSLILVAPVLLLWVLYVIVMAFKRVRDRRGLRLPEKIIAVPIATLGYLVDVYVHLFPMTVLTLDPPRIRDGEYTLTQRFQRYLDHPNKYPIRVQISIWWKPKLNRHDKEHLK